MFAIRISSFKSLVGSLWILSLLGVGWFVEFLLLLGVLWIWSLCWLASNLLLGVCEISFVGWFLDCLVGCL